MTQVSGRAKRGTAREALVAAGVRLFAVRYPDGVAIDDIAREGGVAKGSFYVHFADRDAFVLAVANAVRADIEARIVLTNSGITDSLTRIARAFATCIFYAADHPREALAWSRIDAGQMRPELAINIGVMDDVAQAWSAKAIDTPSAAVALSVLFAMTRAAAIDATQGGGYLAEALGVAMLRALGVPAAKARELIAAALKQCWSPA